MRQVNRSASPSSSSSLLRSKSTRSCYFHPKGSHFRRSTWKVFAGRALIPAERLGSPRQEMHVPVAHQSALAGILLAVAAVWRARAELANETQITRVDLFRPLGRHLTQGPRVAGDGLCICEDGDYRTVYCEKCELERTQQVPPPASPSGPRKQMVERR